MSKPHASLVGAAVQYNPKTGTDEHWPAQVLSEHADGTLDLVVMYRQHRGDREVCSHTVVCVPYSTATKDGGWSWPARE